MSHTDFIQAFTPGAQFASVYRGLLSIRQQAVGELVLPSGRIVACDPGDFDMPSLCHAFVDACPPGRYPTDIALVHQENKAPEYDRVACMRVQFSAAVPVRWQLALLPGQDASTLQPGEFFGYGVDAGLGCFVDAAWLEALDGEVGEALYFDTLLPALTAQSTNDNWAHLIVEPVSGATLVACSSGYGDGSYASYWGIDAAGERCWLVTDFALLATAACVEDTGTVVQRRTTLCCL